MSDSIIVVSVSQGPPGPGAYTTTTASFTQPAVSASVAASFASTTGMVAGQTIYIAGGGYYTVTTLPPGTTQATITNTGATGNAAVSSTVASGGGVTSGGVPGATDGTNGVYSINATEVDVGSSSATPNRAILTSTTLTDASWVTVQTIAMPSDSALVLSAECLFENTGATGGTKRASFLISYIFTWKKVGAGAPVAFGAAPTSILNRDDSLGENTSDLQVIANGTAGVFVQARGVAGHTLGARGTLSWRVGQV